MEDEEFCLVLVKKFESKHVDESKVYFRLELEDLVLFIYLAERNDLLLELVVGVVLT